MICQGLVIEAGQQKPAAFPEPGSRQRLIGQGKARQALIKGQLTCRLRQRDAHVVVQVRRAERTRPFRIRSHQGDERASGLEHRDFPDLRGGAVDALEILRVDLPAAAEDQDLLGAAGHEQEPVPVGSTIAMPIVSVVSAPMMKG